MAGTTEYKSKGKDIVLALMEFGPMEKIVLNMYLRMQLIFSFNYNCNETRKINLSKHPHKKT